MVSDGPTSVRSDRVRAVRRLWKKSGRMKAGRFVVEGMQGVREALAAGVVEQLYSVEPMEGATIVSAEVLAAMCETVTPQGVVAVCRFLEFTAEVTSTHGSSGSSLRRPCESTGRMRISRPVWAAAASTDSWTTRGSAWPVTISRY